MDAGLLQRLQDPALYDHPVTGFDVIETHISWVILTGPFAYKIKKPLDLGFVQCTTLSQRRHYCHEEIRLNRRLAPALYLDVWKIRQDGEAISLIPDSQHQAMDTTTDREYLVRMGQFRQSDLLNHLQERGALTTQHIDSVALQIADFHQRAKRTDPHSAHGTPDVVARWALENFSQTKALSTDAAILESLESLQRWTITELERLGPLMEQRQANGFVRDCHGDLHLGNVAVVENAVTIFDCIEFNDELRNIDTISEIAFLFMDLLSRDETALAWRLLDQYLAQTGDYDGLALLRFYAIYRALVRTKVAMIRQSQPGLSAEDCKQASDDAAIHLALAGQLMTHQRPRLIVIRGLSGSGKSRLATKLVEACGLVRLRSDVERKRLHGLAPPEHSHSDLGGGIYTPDASRQTYDRLAGQAARLLEAGFAVIVDATFLKAWQREPFIRLAHDAGAPLHLLDLHADEVTLRRRIQRRLRKREDPSEADLSVLEQQIATADPLSDAEIAVTTVVNANDGQVDHAMAMLPDQLGCRLC